MCSISLKATDSLFCATIYEQHGRHSSLIVPKRRPREDTDFTVRHFAGDVTYVCAGFLEKNSDSLDSGFKRLLTSSKNSVARELIKIAARREAATAGNGTKDKLATDGGKGGGGRVGGGNASVSKRFCDEIADLVGTLDQTTAHFVRCIKPNGIFAPLKVDDEMVMLQLRNNGSLEAVQLMRAGFPTRVPYEVMVQRYRSSLEKVPGVTDLSDAQFCEVLCAVAELSPEDYRLGVSKIFLRAGRGQFLEELGEKPAEEVLPVLRAKLEEWEARRRAMGTLLKWLFMLVRRCDFRKKRRCGLGWVGLGWGWMGRAGMGWLGWVGMG